MESDPLRAQGEEDESDKRLGGDLLPGIKGGGLSAAIQENDLGVTGHQFL